MLPMSFASCAYSVRKLRSAIGDYFNGAATGALSVAAFDCETSEKSAQKTTPDNNLCVTCHHAEMWILARGERHQGAFLLYAFCDSVRRSAFKGGDTRSDLISDDVLRYEVALKIDSSSCEESIRFGVVLCVTLASHRPIG